MEWYKILIALVFICILFASLILCCIFDYKYKLKKLEFDKKKRDNLECDLMHIYSVLDEINNKIKE